MSTSINSLIFYQTSNQKSIKRVRQGSGYHRIPGFPAVASCIVQKTAVYTVIASYNNELHSLLRLTPSNIYALHSHNPVNFYLSHQSIMFILIFPRIIA